MYKKFKVQILSSGLSLDQLNVYEAFFIKAYNTVETGLNLTTGGLNKRPSEETKAKIGKTQLGKKKIKRSSKGKIKSMPDNIVFDSVTQCSEHYNIPRTTLPRYYNGEVNKKSGQTFVIIK